MSTMSSLFVSTITLGKSATIGVDQAGSHASLHLAILAFHIVNCIPVDAESSNAVELKMSNGQFYVNNDEQLEQDKPHLLGMKMPQSKRDHMIEGILLGKRDYLTEGILLGKRDYSMEGILLGKRDYPTQGFLLGKRNMRFFMPKSPAAGHHGFNN